MADLQPRAVDLRPLAVTAAVAAGSIGLLGLALVTGALGPDLGRGATFCEASRAGLVKQPANTFSNAGFVLAGLAAAWRARRPELLGSRLGSRPVLATVYACVVVLLGPASAAMHAAQSPLGGELDLLSMYLIAGFAAAYALTRWRRRGSGTFALLFGGFVAGCVAVGRWGGEIPVVRYSGNAAFAILLITALAAEAAVARRDEVTIRGQYGALAGGVMTLAFTIWLLDQHGWCDPNSVIQGHAVWHLLGAVAAYLLFRLYASEESAVPG